MADTSSEYPVEIPDWLAAHVEAVARERGISVAEFIKETLEDKEALERLRQKLKPAKR